MRLGLNANGLVPLVIAHSPLLIPDSIAALISGGRPYLALLQIPAGEGAGLVIGDSQQGLSVRRKGARSEVCRKGDSGNCRLRHNVQLLVTCRHMTGCSKGDWLELQQGLLVPASIEMGTQ